MNATRVHLSWSRRLAGAAGRACRRRGTVLSVMLATLFALFMQPISPFVHLTFADWTTPPVYPIRDMAPQYPKPMASPANAHGGTLSPKAPGGDSFPGTAAHHPDAGSAATPGAASQVTVLASGATALVSWTAPGSGPAPSGYTVSARRGDGIVLQSENVAGSPAWFFGLPAGAETFAVTASAGSSSSAPAVSATVTLGLPAGPGAAPAPPRALTASNDGTTLSVAWKAAAAAPVAADSYRITVSAADATVLLTTWCACTSVQLRDLGNAPASVAVAAVSNLGTTGAPAVAQVTPATAAPSPSAAVSAGPKAAAGDDVVAVGRIVALPSTGNPNSPPNAPQSVTATAGNASVSATWTAPHNGPAVSSYTATVYTSSGVVAAAPITTCATCLSANFTGLTNGLSYYVGVYASNSIGNSPSTLSNTVTLPAPPSVSMTVSGGRTTFARGEQVTYSIVVSNPQAFTMSVASVTDALPATVVPPAVSLITEDGATCPTSICAVNGAQVTFSNFTVSANGSHTFLLPVVALGSDRGCVNVPDSVTAGNPYGSSSSSVTTQLCDGGSGNQAWWQLVARSAGPQASASANVASGNLLVTQDDSTLVHLHGKLSFDIHRAYDSAASGNGLSPASLGGWILSFDVVTGGIAASALYVPGTESPSRVVPVTVVDSEGARDVVNLAALASPIDVTGLAGSSSALSTLVPHMLALSGGNTRICVDATGSGPAGDHFGLWRYVQLQSSGSSTPCTPATGTTPAVLGFGLERPDRVSYEFAADGRKLDVQDGDGNELQYQYSTATPPQLTAVVEPASGRSVTLGFPVSGTEVDVTDAARRVTRYFFDAAVQSGGKLVSVQNPDPSNASTLSYTYGGCTGASATQLCSATDPRGHSTTFTYTTTWSDGSAVVGPARLARIVDRAGAATAVSYVLPSDSVNVDSLSGSTLVERQVFSSIDASGSVGEVDGLNGSLQALHTELLYWDTAGTTCRQPDNAVDHDLCRTFRYTFDGQATAEDTSNVFNPLGMSLITHQCTAAPDPAAGNRPAACAAQTRDSTIGYHSQYVEASGAVNTFDDTVAGNGAVTSPGGARADAQTVFAIVDKTQSLSPRGNLSGATVAQYKTTYLVDDNAALSPNLPVAGGACATPSSPVGNTGAVCEIDAPSFDNGVHPNAITRITYRPDGAVASQTSAKSIAETATGTPPAVVDTYYADSDTDLSGNTSAGGWLKAQTDALGRSIVYAYDAAGNVVRTWDRNAVGTTPISSFPGSITAPTSGAYLEVVHGRTASTTHPPIPDVTSYSAPWRFTLETRDQLGNYTVVVPDANGNPLTTTPARGTVAGSTAYDVTQTFDNADRVLTRTTPVEATRNAPTRYTYDALGRTTAVQDPNGNFTTYKYDGVNRVIETDWTRGGWDPANAPAGCRQSTSGDSPFPAGKTLCASLRSYDGVDNELSSTDGNAQVFTMAYDGLDNELSSTDGNAQVFTMAYDGLHRVVRKISPRQNNNLATVEEDFRWDIEGNLLQDCPPLTVATGGSCTAGNTYGTEHSYDASDRVATTTTYRSGVADTTTASYDGDGNQVKSVNARGVATTWTYDLDDHQVSMTVQRAAGNLLTTTYGYDASGNKTSVTDASSRITAYSYDADNRLVDTVQGADSTSAAASGVASADGGHNVRTRLVYDADGHVVASYTPRAFTASVTSPNAEFMRTTVYDNDGRPVTDYVPRFDTASLTDLSLQNTQASQCPTGAPGYPANVGVCVTQYTYDNDGNKLVTVMPTAGPSAQPNGTTKQTVNQYTDDNLLQSTTAPNPQSPGGSVTTLTYFYDGDGRLVKTLDALGRPTIKTWTPDGLLASDAGSAGQFSHVTSYLYDANGNQVQTTDPAGLASTQQWTTDNLLSSSTDPAGDVTSYQYDPLGNVTQQMSPSGNAGDATNSLHLPTTMTYTDDNLMATQTKPVSSSGANPTYRQTIYTYTNSRDKASMDVQLTGGSGGDSGTKTFGYYPDGRLQTETGTDGSTITHQYDADGNQTSVVGVGSTITANYYADDLVRQMSQSDANPTGSVSMGYGYDGGGNTTSRNVSNGGLTYQQQYTYDDAGLISGMSSNDPSASWSWQYDAAGQITQVQMPNTMHMTYLWQSDGTLNVATLFQSNGNSLSQWMYLYDADYRKTEQDYHGVDVFGNPHSLYYNYGYDNASRLTSFTYTVDNSQQPAQTAGWDHDGNRLSWNGKTFTYNADDSMASGPTGGYSYNVAGDMTGDGCKGYGYDGFNRLTSVSAGCGSPTSATYWYDGLNRQRATSAGPFGETSLLRYDGLSQTTLFKQQQFAGNPDLIYTLDNKGNPLADVFETGGQNYVEFLAGDGYGSITTVTDGNGNVSCDAYFNPFGESIFPQTHWGGSPACNTGSANTDRLYHGADRDPSTGSYQLGLRVYDPTKAVFLQPDQWTRTDPIAQLKSQMSWKGKYIANLYGYGLGDPENHYDPSGMCSQNPDDPAAYKNCLNPSQPNPTGEPTSGSTGNGVAPGPASSPASDGSSGGGGQSEDPNDLTPKHWTVHSPPPAPEFIGVPHWTPASLHLLDMNDQRTVTVGDTADGLGITIDRAKLPIEVTSSDDIMKACINCNGTRSSDGKDFKWNASMQTWVCGDKDAAGTNCGESATFQYNWKDNKVEQYDDGVRQGGFLHAVANFIGDHAGAIITGVMIAVTIAALAIPVAGLAVSAMTAGELTAVGATEGGIALAESGGEALLDEAATDLTASVVEDGAENGLTDVAEECAVNSFSGATLVAMADGSKKPIADVQQGDSVMAGDAQRGTRVAEPVARVIVGHGLKHMIAIGVAGETVQATYNHPFWVAEDGAFEWADKLRPGEHLWLEDGRTAVVQSVRTYDEVATVYNLSIVDVHTFFVGDAGVLVHNSCAPVSMDDAVSQGANHVDGDGIMETTGKGTNYQFRNTFTNSSGQEITRVSRFDINPADSHVARMGPHLNLDEWTDGVQTMNQHIPIDPATIRPGDFP